MDRDSLKMRLLFILVIISSCLSYIYFSPTAYNHEKLSPWQTKLQNDAHHKPMRQTSDRYNTVFPQLKKNRKWKSVNHDNYGYVKIFNNLKKENAMNKKFNKGMLYKQKRKRNRKAK